MNNGWIWWEITFIRSSCFSWFRGEIIFKENRQITLRILRVLGIVLCVVHGEQLNWIFEIQMDVVRMTSLTFYCLKRFNLLLEIARNNFHFSEKIQVKSLQLLNYLLSRSQRVQCHEKNQLIRTWQTCEEQDDYKGNTKGSTSYTNFLIIFKSAIQTRNYKAVSSIVRWDKNSIRI